MEGNAFIVSTQKTPKGMDFLKVGLVLHSYHADSV